MKIAEVDDPSLPLITSPFGVGSARTTPKIGQLFDVDLTGLADGYVLIWDAGSSTWIVGPMGSGSGGVSRAWAPLMCNNPTIVTTTGDGLYVNVTTVEGDAILVSVPV